MSTIGTKLHQAAIDSKDLESAKNINEFFSSLSPEAVEKWPFEFEGFQASVGKANFTLSQAGMLKSLNLQLTCEKPDETYVIQNVFTFIDDNLDVEIKSVYRPQKPKEQGSDFATKYLQKLQTFLKVYDETREKDAFFEPSKISLLAKSGKELEHRASSGGYVWARHNFEFKDVEEKQFLQKALLSFGQEKGLKLKNADVKKLANPSDFANFDNGERVKDKFGYENRVGKAFLLENSWYGKWDTTKPIVGERSSKRNNIAFFKQALFRR